MAAKATVALVYVENRAMGAVQPVARDTPAATIDNMASVASSQQSSACPAATDLFWEISVDNPVRAVFGANPTATPTNGRLLNAGTHYYSATPGNKVALIDA